MRKGPVTSFDSGREEMRMWRTHSQMTSPRECSSRIRGLVGEECPTSYGLVKGSCNASCHSYVFLFPLQMKKNYTWSDKLEIVSAYCRK